MPQKRLADNIMEASPSKIPKKSEKSPLDDLSDDTIFHILQLLELRHAFVLAKTSLRFARLYSRNRERLRRAYPKFCLNTRGGCIKIHFGEPTALEPSIALSTIFGGTDDKIVFTRLEGTTPEFELVDGQLVAHLEVKIFDSRTYWRCEVKHGAALDVAKFIFARMVGLADCHCRDINDESLRCLPPNLERISIHLTFRHPSSLSIDAILRFIEKTPSLRNFTFNSNEECGFPQIFFENAAVQKLSSICFGKTVSAGLDDASLMKFVNTKITFDNGTEVTLQGVGEIIEAWKRNEIPTPCWHFNVQLDAIDMSVSMIWLELFGAATLPGSPNASVQRLERTRRTDTARNASAAQSEETEILEIHLLSAKDYKTPEGMQRIQITPKIVWAGEF